MQADDKLSFLIAESLEIYLKKEEFEAFTDPKIDVKKVQEHLAGELLKEHTADEITVEEVDEVVERYFNEEGNKKENEGSYKPVAAEEADYEDLETMLVQEELKEAIKKEIDEQFEEKRAAVAKGGGLRYSAKMLIMEGLREEIEENVLEKFIKLGRGMTISSTSIALAVKSEFQEFGLDTGEEPSPEKPATPQAVTEVQNNEDFSSVAAAAAAAAAAGGADNILAPESNAKDAKQEEEVPFYVQLFKERTKKQAETLIGMRRPAGSSLDESPVEDKADDGDDASSDIAAALINGPPDSALESEVNSEIKAAESEWLNLESDGMEFSTPLVVINSKGFERFPEQPEQSSANASREDEVIGEEKKVEDPEKSEQKADSEAAKQILSSEQQQQEEQQQQQKQEEPEEPQEPQEAQELSENENKNSEETAHETEPDNLYYVEKRKQEVFNLNLPESGQTNLQNTSLDSIVTPAFHQEREGGLFERQETYQSESQELSSTRNLLDVLKDEERRVSFGAPMEPVQEHLQQFTGSSEQVRVNTLSSSSLSNEGETHLPAQTPSTANEENEALEKGQEMIVERAESQNSYTSGELRIASMPNYHTFNSTSASHQAFSEARLNGMVFQEPSFQQSQNPINFQTLVTPPDHLLLRPSSFVRLHEQQPQPYNNSEENLVEQEEFLENQEEPKIMPENNNNLKAHVFNGYDYLEEEEIYENESANLEQISYLKQFPKEQEEQYVTEEQVAVEKNQSLSPPKSEQVSVQKAWRDALKLKEEGCLNDAYAKLLDLDDDIYILRLMLMSGPCVRELRKTTAERLLAKILQIMRSDFLSVLGAKLYGESENTALQSLLTLEEIQELSSFFAAWGGRNSSY